MLVCIQVEYSPLLARHFLGLMFNRLRVLLLSSSPPLDGMSVCRKVTPSISWGFPDNLPLLIYTYGWREALWVRVKCVVQEHNRMTSDPVIFKTFGINYQKVSSFLFILIVVPSYTLRLITRPLRLPQLLSSWPLNRLLGRSILIFSPSAR